MDYSQLLNMFLSQISAEVSKVNYNTWFKNMQILDYKEGNVTVGVPNQFTKEWIESKYQKDIIRILRNIHEGVRSINIVINKVDPATLAKRAQTVIKTPQTGGSLDNLYINKEDNLNPKYSLDDYIVGPFNDLAHSAAKAIISNPGASYNPFFVYGNTGLGKTHLIQSIGNSIKKKYGDKKIFYTSFERFYNDYVSATGSNSINKFKEKHRSYDVLIMDDIQFITGKDKTQDELFHIFNIMYENNKQIVFSSDVHPNFIDGIDDRLRSRFNHGLVVDIEAPPYESRLAILKKKSKDNRDKISDDVLDFIAQNVTGNIRELEGVINSLISLSELKNTILDIEEVKIYLKNNIKKKRNVSITDIIKVISKYYGIPEDFVYSKTRRKDIIKPRQIIMYLLREEYDMSYPMIGEKLGGRDHTTVIHSYEKIKRELINNYSLSKEVEELKSMLN